MEIGIRETLRLKGHVRIEKFAQGVDPKVGIPYEVIESENLFLTVGINEILSLMTGGSANHFDNSNATIGVGNDKTTAPAASQTDLQGASKTYKAMDSGYPTTPSSGQVQFKASFGSSDANYEWGEFTVKQSVSTKCLNRSTNGGAGWGTKASGTTWTFTVTISIA